MKDIEILGIGNPLMDFIAKGDEDSLARFELRKGTSILVEKREFDQFSSALANHFYSMPGGSSANAVVGAAKLGAKAAFLGTIGNDNLGSIYSKKMKAAKVKPLLTKVKGVTGTCLCIVTPDKERTMATYLGTSGEFTKKNLDLGAIRRSKILHIEGYQLLTAGQKEAIFDAMIEAKAAGTRVSFDFADPFLVKRHKDEIKNIVDNFADIIFANEEEMRIFSGKKPESALRDISKKVEFAAVKLGRKGSIVQQRSLQARIPIYNVKAVDTTGAGDLYAAGFLYGLVKGKPLLESGHIASFMAAKVVAQYGAYFDYNINKEMRRTVKL